MYLRHWHVGTAKGGGEFRGGERSKKILNSALCFHIELCSFGAGKLPHT